jgi:parallel beta-helix repeat protein
MEEVFIKLLCTNIRQVIPQTQDKEKKEMERMVSCLMVAVLLISACMPIIGGRSRVAVLDSHSVGEVGVTAPITSLSGSAEVRFDPDKYTFIVEKGVSVGYRFNTTIEIYDVAELFAWQVRIYFNNTLLNATNAYYHPNEPIHNLNHMPVSPVIRNDYNATHGYVQHGISAIYPNCANATAEDYPLGVGICIMELEVINAPTNPNDFQCDLVLSNSYTYLLWKDGVTEIPCDKMDGWYCLDNAAAVPTDYATIQEAINALDPTITNPYKNTVFVHNGTYHENVIVNKTARLIGESINNVIINGNDGVVATIEADDAIIEGFTLTSGSNGFWIHTSTGGMISNNNITGNDYGIYNTFSGFGQPNNDWIIHGNNITENSADGIHAYACGRNVNGWTIYGNNITENGNNGIFAEAAWGNPAIGWTIFSNNISENNGSGIRTDSNTNGWNITGNMVTLNSEYGIHLSGGNNVLRRNQMSNNAFNFGVSDSYLQDIDTSNTVNGKPIYYLVNEQAGQVPADAGYVALVDSSNIVVRNFNSSHNEQGILLVRTNNITLDNFCSANNVYGIYVVGIQNCTLSGYRILRHTYGIYVDQAKNLTLTELGMTNNTYGVFLIHSENVTISACDISQNECGVHISESNGNQIYHNNFMQNTYQVTAGEGIANDWNISYASGGNYWSDHTGPDECTGIYQNETGSDGIVDIKYSINQDNIDYYPLSTPWSSPVRIITPGNTTYRGENVSLTFSVDFGPSWMGYSLDDQANVTIAGNTTLSGLSCGSHHITIYANDTSGNMFSSVEVYFTITFLCDLNYDRTVDIKDVAIVCYAYGSEPGDPRWNVVADLNRDLIIDIEDVALVVTCYGNAWE